MSSRKSKARFGRKYYGFLEVGQAANDHLGLRSDLCVFVHVCSVLGSESRYPILWSCHVVGSRQRLAIPHRHRPLLRFAFPHQLEVCSSWYFQSTQRFQIYREMVPVLPGLLLGELQLSFYVQQRGTYWRLSERLHADGTRYFQLLHHGHHHCTNRVHSRHSCIVFSVALYISWQRPLKNFFCLDDLHFLFILHRQRDPWEIYKTVV